MDGEILKPKVLIVPFEQPNPTVSGASIRGMLNLSGSTLYIVTDDAGTWTALN
jgi:hypothetical protein